MTLEKSKSNSETNGSQEARSKKNNNDNINNNVVALSGISGQFPLSDNIEQFMENLFKGVDLVTADEIRWPIGFQRLPARNGKVYAMDKFDLNFFNLSKEEAELIDPQDRLLMEAVYSAILDAGVNPESLRGTNTGYFHGACYVETNQNYETAETVPEKYPKSLVTRIPLFLGLRGPMLEVDTACCSGLSAFSEAYYAVKYGICDAAIATASNTVFRPRISYQFRDLKMITKDGKCKCLDSSADGYVRSEAIVATFLQRSTDAKRVYCYLLGCRSNSDGFKEEGITFPSIKGQIQLLKETYEEASLDPASIDYIEAHITGTKAGDPVETEAMYRVIASKRKEPLLVGCLKSNIGHTEGSSGLCAIAKACIVYQTSLIPPNIHYNNPNTSLMGIDDGKLKPVTEITPFKGKIIPVNSFGFGGANTHLITSIAPTASDSPFRRPLNTKLTSPNQPPYRLIVAPGRTKGGVESVFSQLLTHSKYMTREYLALLDNFATISIRENGFNCRGFAILHTNGAVKSYYKPVRVESVSSVPKLILEFKGPSITMAETFDKCCETGLLESTKEIYESVVRNLGHNFTKADLVIAKSVALQVGVIDLMAKLKVQVAAVYGSSTGELAAAYFEGLLSGEKTIEASFHVTNGLETYLSPEFDKPIRRSNKWLSSDQSNFVTGKYLKESVTRLNNSFSHNSRIMNDGSLVVEVGSDVISLRDGNNNAGGSLIIDPYLNTLMTLGQLYVCGINVEIAPLFPKVEYPLPPGTPFFSTMVKWDHSVPISIKPFLFDPSSGVSYQTTKNIVHRFDSRKADETFVFDHKINGRALFPATGYLMIVWETLAKMKKLVLTEMPIKFERVKFLRATVLSTEAEAVLSVRINEDLSDFEVKEGDVIVVSGKVAAVDEEGDEKQLRQICSSVVDSASTLKSGMSIGAQDIYKELRIRGYEYGPYFQAMIEASADGTHGKVIWRDVVTKSVKETLGLETEEEFAYLWAKSWCAFMDSMLQLQLIKSTSDTRCLLVPTSIESLVVFPDLLKKSIAESPVVSDPLTQNNASVITAYNSTETGTLCTQGMVMTGFRGSFMPRKKQIVKLLQYSFVPFNLDECMDEELTDQVYRYQKTLKSIESNDGPSEIPSDFDIEDKKFALLKSKLNKTDKEKEEEKEDLTNDLVAGSLGSSHFLSHQTFYKSTLDLAVYNLIYGSQSKKLLSILEVNLNADENDLLITKTQEALSVQLLANAFNCEYSLLHSNPTSLTETATSEYKSVITADETLNTSKLPSVSLLLLNFTGQMEKDDEKTRKLLNDLLKVMDDGSFALVLYKLSNGSCDSSVKDLTNLKNLFISNGLLQVSNKQLSPLLPHQLLLLRKPSKESQLPIKVIKVGSSDYDSWVEQVKVSLEEKNCRVFLVNNRKDPLDQQKVTGLLGMTKSLRLEAGGELIRCFIDFSSKSVDSSEIDLNSISKLDMAYTVRLDSQFGTYEHILMPEEITCQAESYIKTEHVYLRSLKPGDLSSLTWVENQVAHESKYLKSHVKVHYSALNFKDVLFATGRLPMDAIPSNMSPLVAQDTLLGLEFSGVESESSKKVMGILPCKALATSIPIQAETKDFMWPVPDDWTLEDAATVPVVYSTVIYALLIRGKLQPRESILIHAGAGGVGLAAINVALAYNCEIFTTVGSAEKKEFLLKEFGGRILPERILNSRSVSFEFDILQLTDGKGVDVVLNSLSDEKFESTLRCLNYNGRFLEIGKVDMLADRNINLTNELQGNQSFHGVFLDTLMKYSDCDYFSHHVNNEKAQLYHLMMHGIEKGFVKPLPRIIFEKEKVTDAFRFMATGKHIGKVLIKMRSEDGNGLTKGIKSSFLSTDKSYLVIGGLGGLGLELVQWLVTRGARHIVVNSRRGISTPLQQWTISRLKSEGINVVICQADCIHDDGAKELIDLANSMAPLGGIFNSAVVYQDCLFSDVTVDIFEQVASPKAAATINLDKLSRIYCDQLDYFVTFSSISSGRGNEGQTNYNFGNSIMDSICMSRVGQGLHGLSIQWGVIGDVGLVADLHSGSSHTSSGTIGHSNGPSEVVLLGSASQRVSNYLVHFL